MARKKSITELGGISHYLDATAAEHFNHPYTEFDLYCRLGLANTAIMRLMNVRTVDTIKSWKQKRDELHDVSPPSEVVGETPEL